MDWNSYAGFGNFGLILGIMVMMAPAPGSLQIGLALLLLGIGIGLTGFILYKLLNVLAAMVPS